MPAIISPIAIDLGGKFTGLYLPQYEEGCVPSAVDALATTLVMPEEGNKMTWSQTSRTATRHRIRCNKRRKLAKRLLKVVIESGLEYSLSSKEWEALCGLLNRRGYNRIEIEANLSVLTAVEPLWFGDQFPNFFDTAVPLNEQWDQLADNTEKLRALANEPNFWLDKKQLQSLIPSDYSTEEKALILSAVTEIKLAVSSILNQLDSGAQHRKVYLQKIKAEIAKDSRLAALQAKFGLDALQNLVGNISNFQLRTLRWYFNDLAHQTNDQFNAEKLHQVILRWVEGWHVEEEEEKQSRQEIMAAFKRVLDPLALLQKIAPEKTIPPYEDQNNRRPPKDQTLWLSPTAMQIQFSDSWKLWANNLRRKNPDWAEGIEMILEGYDRKSRLPKQTKAGRVLPSFTNKELADSYLLQRLLDRSKTHDPYALRALAQRNIGGSLSQSLAEAKALLSHDIGSQHVDKFLQFCAGYYQEVELAKNGLWSDDERNLLELAALNPPQKKKILPVLVGNVLGVQLTPREFERFKIECWEKIVTGRSTVNSTCKAIEETRKEYGNIFNERLKALSRKEAAGSLEKKLTDDDKKIWSIWQKAQQVSEIIASYFHHDEKTQKHYRNCYSLAQLYTLLETERNGFSKVSLAAHHETSWRMQRLESAEGIDAARCSRLPADSVRPFDGVLRRVLERQAIEISRLKSEQVQKQTFKNRTISIPILIEENRFAFSLSLAELKKAPARKRGDLQKQLERQGTPWVEKDLRIKEASQNICPYTGGNIGKEGEIDHIVPRALSTSRDGTVFNSEANLIWCSREGNRKKGEQIYFLENLNAHYLHVQFGSSDAAIIAQKIESTVSDLPPVFTFDMLETEQLKALRHALFLNTGHPARRLVEQKLASQQSTRVNGTQAWLVKRVIQLLKQQLTSWAAQHQNTLSFHAARIDARDASEIRHRLADHTPALAKPSDSQQPVASHVVDALCTFACAAAQPKLEQTLCIGDALVDDMAFMASQLPQQVEVKWITQQALYNKDNIQSQALFKEGIYAEHFFTFMVLSRSGLVRLSL